MSWQDLLQPEAGEQRTLPWLGGRQLRAAGGRSWKIQGPLPAEYGWYTFTVTGGRTASLVGAADPDPSIEQRHKTMRGFLVGNRLIPDTARVDPDPNKLADQTLQVELVEEGLERFSRAVVAQVEGHYIYIRQEFPEGPEQEVLMAYQDRKASVEDIKGVTPALDLAFRFITWQRVLDDERALERERLRQQARARAEAEARHQEALRKIGTAEGRRELAKHDFAAAAKAALAVCDAELLDTRSVGGGRMVVQYRYQNRRLECEVERDTLRVIDAGVCLTDHRTGEKGDTRFTLESLPTVIGEALRRGKLVVYRHAPGDVRGNGDWEPEDEEEDW